VFILGVRNRVKTEKCQLKSLESPYLLVHWWVFSTFAFSQALGFPSFQQLAPKAFLRVKAIEDYIF